MRWFFVLCLVFLGGCEATVNTKSDVYAISFMDKADIFTVEEKFLLSNAVKETLDKAGIKSYEVVDLLYNHNYTPMDFAEYKSKHNVRVTFSFSSTGVYLVETDSYNSKYIDGEMGILTPNKIKQLTERIIKDYL